MARSENRRWSVSSEFPIKPRYLIHCCDKKFYRCICFVYFSVNIVYVDKDGNKTNVRGKVGDNILYLAHRYGIHMEGKM